MARFFTFTFLTTLFLLLTIPSRAFAAGEVSLDPSSGIIDGGGQSVDVVVDAQGEEVEIIEIIIEYGGDINYIGSSNGDIDGCSADVTVRSSEDFDDLFIFCMLLSSEHTGSGVFVTLDFEPTGEGGANIDIVSVDLGLASSPSFQTTHTYETTMETGGGAAETEPDEPTPEGEADQLPRTSVSRVSYILVGILLLSLPIVLNKNLEQKKERSMTEKVR